MRTYLHVIKIVQTIFLGTAISIMLVLPLLLVFKVEPLSEETILRLYDISHVSIFFVMLIRPLADIFMGNKWIRPLVILRKGVGVFSGSVVISFIFAKLIVSPMGYLGALSTWGYWSLQNFALLAHLADISAILLLITSNNLSKRLLGAGWKKIQKLSYVFFYASSLYVYLTFDNIHLLISMGSITAVTALAYMTNRQRALNTSRSNLQTV